MHPCRRVCVRHEEALATHEHVFDTRGLDLRRADLLDDHRLERIRRSLAMLPPESMVWTREQAIGALEEIQRLRHGMKQLLEARRDKPVG